MGTYDRNLIAKTITDTTFEFGTDPYVLAHLDLKDYKQAATLLADVPDTFAEIMRDGAEVSIVVTQATWENTFVPAFGEQPVLAPLTWIFCKVDPTVTGYIMTVLEYLSPNDVGIYVQGAYVTDHIFVHTEDAEKAKGLLDKLQADMKANLADNTYGKD